MTKLRQELGILRSKLIYYGKPMVMRRLKNFYAQFVGPGDLCFDIGAHLGNRVDAWSRLGANTVAVDPQPRCMRFLEKKFGENPNVTLLEKACADKPGEATFYVSSLTPTISTLSGKEWKSVMQELGSYKIYWDEEVKVEVITLDQLIDTYGMPVFTKIDVEDFEVQVLEGLSQPLPLLSIEYLAAMAKRTIRCVEILENLAPYEYNWSYGESLKLESKEWVGATEMVAFLSNLTFHDRSGDIYARRSQTFSPEHREINVTKIP